MVFKWLTGETQSAYIARPTEADGMLIYMHPDKSIPRGAKLTVRADECVLFFREGQFIDRLDAGTYLLDTNNIPFLGHLIVDKFTGANHFITQLFFVTIAECACELPPSELGQYVDLNSRHVVAIQGQASYTLQVADPVRLVTQLGGQHGTSTAATINVLNGRLMNGFRRIVGQLVESLPVLSVVSNTQAELISEKLKQFAGDEFRAVGVELRKVLAMELSLDTASMTLLREFGKQEATLQIQARGAELAQRPGFAEFNVVSGQRAALEGLGKGLAEGKGTMFLGGGGLGADLTAIHATRGSMSGRMRNTAPVGGGGSILATPRNYFMQTATGEAGPYSARQLALVIASAKRILADVMIRGDDDPAGSYISADLEPKVVAEYQRRVPAGSSPAASPGSNSPNVFETAFDAAGTGGVLSADELAMLSRLAIAVGLARDPVSAAALVRERARARNLKTP